VRLVQASALGAAGKRGAIEVDAYQTIPRDGGKTCSGNHRFRPRAGSRERVDPHPDVVDGDADDQ